MNEEGGFPILPFLVASLVLCYFGLEVNRQRNKLRSIFNVFDREETPSPASSKSGSPGASSSRSSLQV